MRISDWSSDVCSSDLGDVLVVTLGELVPHQHHRDAPGETDQDDACHVFRAVAQEDNGEREHQCDRQSVVSGKSVSVRVGLGGRRIIKNKTTEKASRTRVIQTVDKY